MNAQRAPWIDHRALAEAIGQGAADALSRTIGSNVELGMATPCDPELMVATLPAPIQALEIRFGAPLDDVIVLISALREDALRSHAELVADATLVELAAIIGTTPQQLGEVTFSDVTSMESVEQAADMCDALYLEATYSLELPAERIYVVLGTDLLDAAARVRDGGRAALDGAGAGTSADPRAAETTMSALDALDAELAQVAGGRADASRTPASDPLGTSLDASATGTHPSVSTGGAPRAAWTQMLSGVEVELSAELGRTELELGAIAGLSRNSVLTLDQLVDEPVTVYVNGVPFATARLVVVDGEYGIEIIEVTATAAIPSAMQLAA